MLLRCWRLLKRGRKPAPGLLKITAEFAQVSEMVTAVRERYLSLKRKPQRYPGIFSIPRENCGCVMTGGALRVIELTDEPLYASDGRPTFSAYSQRRFQAYAYSRGKIPHRWTNVDRLSGVSIGTALLRDGSSSTPRLFPAYHSNTVSCLACIRRAVPRIAEYPDVYVCNHSELSRAAGRVRFNGRFGGLELGRSIRSPAQTSTNVRSPDNVPTRLTKQRNIISRSA